MCYNGILFISGQQLFTKFQGDFVLFEFWTNDFLDTNSDAYINLIQALSEDVSHSLSVCMRACVFDTSLLPNLNMMEGK